MQRNKGFGRAIQARFAGYLVCFYAPGGRSCFFNSIGIIPKG